jgi:hypothetical protein
MLIFIRAVFFWINKEGDNYIDFMNDMNYLSVQKMWSLYNEA